ncbi:MAG: hypothetical protein V3V05_06400 [Pontiella sp.]
MRREATFFYAGVIVLMVIGTAMAEQQMGKIVDAKTGVSSGVVALTNGASFKLNDAIYRLEIDQSSDELLMEKLEAKGVPVRIQDLAAHDAFTMLTHLSGVPIVCARNVEKDAKVNVNTQDGSIMQIIEQICFQIDATPTMKNETIWIHKK